MIYSQQRRQAVLVALVTAAAFLFQGATATVSVQQSIDADALVQSLLGPGVSLVPGQDGSSTSSVTTAPLRLDSTKFCAGTFTDTQSSTGMASGVGLSTGWIGSLIGPNTRNFQSSAALAGGGSTTTLLGEGYDVCHLSFQFTCPAGSTGVSLDFVYGSEHYDGTYNGVVDDAAERLVQDKAGIFLNNQNIALLPSGDILQSGKIPSSFLVDNTLGRYDIQMNAFTVKLAATGPVDPSGINTIDMFVMDAGNAKLDSWLLLEAASLHCTGAGENGACAGVFPTPPTPTISVADRTVYTNTQAAVLLPVPAGYTLVRVDWGDETEQDAASDSHVYTTPGTYTVAVTTTKEVIDCIGANRIFSFVASVTITVLSSSSSEEEDVKETLVASDANAAEEKANNGIQISGIPTTPQTVRTPITVSVDCTGIAAASQDAVYVTIDFKDGSNPAFIQVDAPADCRFIQKTHAYSKEGTFPITVSVYDLHGGTIGSVETFITISAGRQLRRLQTS